MPDSAPLERLRESLERIEPRRGAAVGGLIALGAADVDSALGGGIARGRLHEIFAGAEEGTSAAGFAALLALKAGGAIFWLRTEGAERQAGRLHATGLKELGIDPAMLLLGLVPDETALLRAAADAARCGGLGTVLVECWGRAPVLDLTASRRLMLAAEGSGVTLLLLRVAAEPVPSACDTRWRVAAAPSIALEAEAPGAPMFDINLLRQRAGAGGGAWRVEWNREEGCFREAPRAEASGFGEPADAGAALPLAAGGAAADHPPPSRRSVA